MTSGTFTHVGSDKTIYANITLAQLQALAPAEALAAARAAQNESLIIACEASIVAGFTSTALGAPHLYPSAPTDQANLAAATLASLLPNNPSVWTTVFMCADASGAWARLPHTSAQIQQVAADGRARATALLLHLDALRARIASAPDIASVQAVAWTTP